MKIINIIKTIISWIKDNPEIIDKAVKLFVSIYEAAAKRAKENQEKQSV